MIFLNGANIKLPLFHRLDAVYRRVGGINGRDTGDAVNDGLGPDGDLVGFGFFPAGGIDNQLNLTVFDEIDHIGTALTDLENHLDVEAVFSSTFRVPAVAMR